MWNIWVPIFLGAQSVNMGQYINEVLFWNFHQNVLSLDINIQLQMAIEANKGEEID